MGIRYGRVPQQSTEIEWHFVSHIECDGIGGLVRLLRQRGASITELPQTKHPCRKAIAPLWNLWRDNRNAMKCALRADWLLPNEETHSPHAAAWQLFTAEETLRLVNQCRNIGVTVNSFLLKHLDQAIRPELREPMAKIRWLIPVNLRGDVLHDDDTANHVSCVEPCIAPTDLPEAIQADILKRLKRGEHRANHLLLMTGGFLSHRAKLTLLEKTRDKPHGNIGSFSNLGVWQVNMPSSDGWVFCPPLVTGQLLGAGCVTINGRLGLAIQGRAAASWMDRWVSRIQVRSPQVPQKV
jgi:hypothetical protein